MSQQSDNEQFVREVQLWLRDNAHEVSPDRWAGNATMNAWLKQTGRVREPGPIAASFPAPDPRSLVECYGEPGRDLENSLVFVDLPYPMVLAWDTSVVVRRQRCHPKVAESLHGALSDILSHYGSQKEIEARGLDRLGGTYIHRPMRGSKAKTWSVHAYGAAIDIDPLRNTLWMPWVHAPSGIYPRAVARWQRQYPGKDVVHAAMDVAVVEIFERRGWTSGGRAWGYDAMHFQATR